MGMHEPIKPGENPRHVLRHHRERGVKRFSYTYRDLADLFGVSVWAVKAWAGARHAPEDRLDPASLKSVCEWWEYRKQQKEAMRRFRKENSGVADE